MPRIYTRAELNHDHSPIQEVFFESMISGWVSDNPKVQVKRAKGAVGVIALQYTREPWQVVDEYNFPSSGGHSAGITRIFHDQHLVWMMQYFGNYPEETMDFLKDTLKMEYSRRRFSGGRGAMSRVAGLYNYINEIEEGDFCRFSGIERIRHKGRPEVIGWHRYYGGMMV